MVHLTEAIGDRKFSYESLGENLAGNNHIGLVKHNEEFNKEWIKTHQDNRTSLEKRQNNFPHSDRVLPTSPKKELMESCVSADKETHRYPGNSLQHQSSNNRPPTHQDGRNFSRTTQGRYSYEGHYRGLSRKY